GERCARPLAWQGRGGDPGLIDRWICPGTAACARRDAHTLRRPHVLVLDLLPELVLRGFGATEHCFLWDAVELRQLVDERILSRVVMRHSFHFDAFIRDRARMRRGIEWRAGQCKTSRQVVRL